MLQCMCILMLPACFACLRLARMFGLSFWCCSGTLYTRDLHLYSVACCAVAPVRVGSSWELSELAGGKGARPRWGLERGLLAVKQGRLCPTAVPAGPSLLDSLAAALGMLGQVLDMRSKAGLPLTQSCCNCRHPAQRWLDRRRPVCAARLHAVLALFLGFRGLPAHT